MLYLQTNCIAIYLFPAFFCVQFASSTRPRTRGIREKYGGEAVIDDYGTVLGMDGGAAEEVRAARG
jgi:hypothetical protein